MRWLLSVCLFWIGQHGAAAQATGRDTVLLDNSFVFADGLYASFEALRRNEPTHRWEEVYAQLFANPQTFVARLLSLDARDPEAAPVPADSLWGIVLEGIPYVRVPADAHFGKGTPFVGLKVRGRLAYYTWESRREEEVEIRAYNPVNGRPFRTGRVSKEVPVYYEQLLHFADGRIEPFTIQTVLAAIADDEKLHRTLAELPEKEAWDQLYKMLLVFDDRNPFYLVVEQLTAKN